MVVQCDVSSETECRQLVQQTVDRFGAIDILVLNAGVGQVFFLEAMDEQVNFRQFMDVNYYGCVFPTLAALPYLQRSGGRIVVVSSLGGLIPFPRQTFYNASKYALMGFYETLRLELQSKQSGVSISIVCPGFVQTEITAGAGIGRRGQPIGQDQALAQTSATDGKAAEKKKSLPISMITAAKCAADVIVAAENRTSLTITPWWYRPVYHLRHVFPSAVDELMIKLFAPNPKKLSN
jgi:short-subunit dehydrogenase